MKLLLFILISLPVFQAQAQNKVKLKKGVRTVRLSKGDPVYFYDSDGFEIEKSSLRIKGICDSGFLFVNEIISGKVDTLKRHRISNWKKRRGWIIQKSYGSGGYFFTRILCKPEEYTLDTVKFSEIGIVKKYTPLPDYNDFVEGILLSTGVLTILVSPLTGINSDSYNWKTVGITAASGLIVAGATICWLYYEIWEKYYHLDVWKMKYGKNIYTAQKTANKIQ